MHKWANLGPGATCYLILEGSGNTDALSTVFFFQGGWGGEFTCVMSCEKSCHGQSSSTQEFVQPQIPPTKRLKVLGNSFIPSAFRPHTTTAPSWALCKDHFICLWSPQSCLICTYYLTCLYAIFISVHFSHFHLTFFETFTAPRDFRTFSCVWTLLIKFWLLKIVVDVASKWISNQKIDLNLSFSLTVPNFYL